jgi:hypothetical protein
VIATVIVVVIVARILQLDEDARAMANFGGGVAIREGARFD